MSPLPLFKLGALLAKQVSKPLGKILKDKAKQSEKFKNYLIIPSANLYHNMDIILRMRLLGLGSPDKVPPLTEKAAIELGGDILSEFFVFGTAVALLLIEYIRQSSNTVKKENALVQKVSDLELEQHSILEKLDKANKRMTEINEYLAEQKTKVEDLNAKYIKLDTRRNLKFATQAAQTGASASAIVGKVMFARDSKVNPSSDVTNSILYQVAHSTVDQLKNIVNIVPLLKFEKEEPPVPAPAPPPQPTVPSVIIPKTNLANKAASNKAAVNTSKPNDKQGSSKKQI